MGRRVDKAAVIRFLERSRLVGDLFPWKSGSGDPTVKADILRKGIAEGGPLYYGDIETRHDRIPGALIGDAIILWPCRQEIREGLGVQIELLGGKSPSWLGVRVPRLPAAGGLRLVDASWAGG